MSPAPSTTCSSNSSVCFEQLVADQVTAAILEQLKQLQSTFEAFEADLAATFTDFRHTMVTPTVEVT